MSKQTQMFSMSLLPILLIVGLIIGAGFLLIQGDIQIPWLKKDNTLEIRRLEGFPTTVYTNEIVDKKRLVIKSQEELETFFKEVDTSGNIALAEKIDFDKEYLLAVSSKTVNTKGFDMKIKKIYVDEKNQSLLVSIKQAKPGETCTYDQDPNVPVDIVAIDKTDKSIEFELIKETEECN